MDFLIVPTVGFRLLFVLVILRHERRRLDIAQRRAVPMAEWTTIIDLEAAIEEHSLIRDGCYGLARREPSSSNGCGEGERQC